MLMDAGEGRVSDTVSNLLGIMHIYVNITHNSAASKSNTYLKCKYINNLNHSVQCIYLFLGNLTAGTAYGVQ